MSQLDRTHDHRPEFDLSLQAVLGLAWLLSQLEALRPESKTAGSRAESCAPSSSSRDHDPASLAVLGVIAVAAELSPMLEALRTGSPRRLPMGVRAEGRREIERIEPEVRAGARRNRSGLDGLLR
jgi:hypothetical protein